MQMKFIALNIIFENIKHEKKLSIHFQKVITTKEEENDKIEKNIQLREETNKVCMLMETNK